jgi:hypothetical protein
LQDALFPNGRKDIGRDFGHAFEGWDFLFDAHVEGRNVKVFQLDILRVHDALLTVMRTTKGSQGAA